MKTVRKASLRTSTLDYAKRKVKGPTLAPVAPLATLPNPRDYAKFTPLKLPAGEGPDTLKNLGKLSKVRI